MVSPAERFEGAQDTKLVTFTIHFSTASLKDILRLKIQWLEKEVYLSPLFFQKGITDQKVGYLQWVELEKGVPQDEVSQVYTVHNDEDYKVLGEYPEYDSEEGFLMGALAASYYCDCEYRSAPLYKQQEEEVENGVLDTFQKAWEGMKFWKEEEHPHEGPPIGYQSITLRLLLPQVYEDLEELKKIARREKALLIYPGNYPEDKKPMMLPFEKKKMTFSFQWKRFRLIKKDSEEQKIENAEELQESLENTYVVWDDFYPAVEDHPAGKHFELDPYYIPLEKTYHY